MVRDNVNDFFSTAASTPIILSQHNRFREGYFKGSLTVSHGRNEWKFGVESDNLFLHENFSWAITDRTQFDDSTPGTFNFLGTRPDLEQAAFVQDLIHLGNWTLSAGLRCDHYQLLANQNAVSPRLSVAHFFPSADIVLHFSYDRIFQTPDPSLTLDQCIQGQVQICGQQVVNGINFDRGRIYPTVLLSASLGADIYKSDRLNMRFQVDGQNLSNVVDVIDFGGLFSGNAIGPSRSIMLRLQTLF